MSRWRPLEAYTLFARTIVLYMWEQRPPLLPAQFADRAGVSRQLISRILNQDVQPDPLAVRSIARSMHMPTSTLFTLAGYTSADDPLYAPKEAWDVILAAIAGATYLPEEERTQIATRLSQIRTGSLPTPVARGIEKPNDGVSRNVREENPQFAEERASVDTEVVA